jgi:uncharacterized protein YdhG (YjbR/CyaY superfamily)
MSGIDFKSVEEYMASHPVAVRGTLELVRGAILKALPGADEVISYRMPTYKIDGELVLHFAGWKQHYSLYPVGERLITAFKDELARYKVEKSTLRFPLSEPVPVKLIERIAKFRAKEAVNRLKVKAVQGE